MLDKLCRGESGRILRSVSPPAGETAASYELFHDVLAEPILDWRNDTSSSANKTPEAQRLREEQDAEKERRRRRRARRFVVVLMSSPRAYRSRSAPSLVGIRRRRPTKRRDEARQQTAIARKAEEKGRLPSDSRSLAAQLVLLEYEPFSPHATNDPASNCKVGFGHLLHLGPCTAIDRSRWPNLTVEPGAQAAAVSTCV